MRVREEGSWSPYLAGALTGLLAVFSMVVVGKFFGASTSFVRTTGMIEEYFFHERVATMDYFISKTLKIDWQWMFVVGIFIGALFSSIVSRTYRLEGAPLMWSQRFGGSVIKRGFVAFLGGLIAMFGARLAGGCPSGHGLSGMMQLSLSGYISLVCFFLGGVLCAKKLYKSGGEL